MGSELDAQLRAIMTRLTAARSPFERGVAERGGQSYPVFRNAPPTLPALFDESCARHAEREFIVDGELRLTFGQVHALARRVAGGLVARHGLQPGQRVGIAARNSASWIIAYMGVLMAGGCAVLLNGWWTGEELAEGVELAGCSLVLADSQRAERLSGRVPADRLVVFGHGDPETGMTPVLDDGTASLPEITGGDLATMVFTSGSTGRSKAAFSDHTAVVQATMNFAAQSLMLFTQLTGAGSQPAERQTALLCVPMFHVTGEVAVLLQSFVIGRRLVVLPKWDALDAMRLIEAERITFFVGVPLMSYEIATHPRRGEFDLSSCRTFAAGGAARPPAHVGALRRAMPHAYPVLGYGLTETNCVGAMNLNENYLAKPGSAGPAAAPLVELAVFGPDGQRLPAGETGEIAIRSICNVLGYWNNPQATAEALRDDGFFLTGDIGHLDAEGYLFIVDRRKDMINRGGENISCGEVEQAIYSFPGIAEASVFGLPDERFGEVPVAVCVTQAGRELDAQALREHLARHIAHFKIPVRFWRQDQPLPRLGTEKVDKLSLKARYSQTWESARSAA